MGVVLVIIKKSPVLWKPSYGLYASIQGLMCQQRNIPNTLIMIDEYSRVIKCIDAQGRERLDGFRVQWEKLENQSEISDVFAKPAQLSMLHDERSPNNLANSPKPEDAIKILKDSISGNDKISKHYLMTAYAALGKLTNEQSYVSKLADFAKDEDKFIKYAAINAIKNMPHSLDTVPIYEALLDKEEDEVARTSLATGLYTSITGKEPDFSKPRERSILNDLYSFSPDQRQKSVRALISEIGTA